MQQLKQYAKRARRSAYELIRNPKYSRPSLNDLDRKLAPYLGFRDGFFIEAGANDGFNQSNTYYLERFLGWKGVLVEGIPELYERCRRERPRSTVINCALVAPDYTEATVPMQFANLMSLVSGSRGSVEHDASHVADGLRVQQLSRSYTVDVPARTLESVLDEVGVPSVGIDFFSLDVEGFELNVLRGLNLDRYRPRYLLIEANRPDEIDGFLADTYRRLDQLSYHDVLYERIGDH